MSLIAWYKLDGNANDSVGNKHGTPNSVSWVDGKLGQCGSFNGINSWIDCGNLGNPGHGSISLWFQKDNTDAQYLLDGRGTGNWWFLTYYNGHDVNFYNNVVWDGLSLNTWYHVVVTATPDKTEMYINGDLVDTGGGNTIDFRSVRMGTRYTNSGYLSGLLDDVRIYDHTLSTKEVKELSRGKVLHYKMDDENIISDSSGYNNNGVNNGATFTTDSLIGKGCYSFDGINDYITISNNPYLQVDNDISISFWLYVRTHSTRTTLIDKAYGGEFTINLETSGPHLRLYRGLSGGNSTPYSNINSGTIPTNQWVHACIKVSGTEAKWFIDSVNTATSTSDNFVGSVSNNNVRIGKGYTDGYFDGKIDDVRIYATALSQEDIEELYNQRASIDNNGNFYSLLFDEGFSYISSKSSSEIGWTGGSGYNDTQGESDPCSGLVTFEEALTYTHSRGARLPTIEELENSATVGTGCSYDYELCWTCNKGNDSSEHWVSAGDPTRTGSSYGGDNEIKSNTSTAYVRMVTDNDINRKDSVKLQDKFIRDFLWK